MPTQHSISMLCSFATTRRFHSTIFPKSAHQNIAGMNFHARSRFPNAPPHPTEYATPLPHLRATIPITPAHTPTDENGRTAPMQAATSEHKFSACNLASCTGSGCAWDSAPYLCTDGSSVGGCAADASAWAPENGACIAFCDLSDCSDILDKAEVGLFFRWRHAGGGG